MAYYLHHEINFYNCLNEKIFIELYRKDVIPDEVLELLANSFTVQYPNGDGDKFDTIITSEAKLSITLYPQDNVTFEDFIITLPDEWKMIAYDDDQVVFAGFLIPGGGRADFQDKPYDLTLSAIDGISLLKGTPLTKDNGDNFTGVNLIKDYVIAILNKTGLGLNLRLFSNIVEESMQDRTQNEQADTFNQTGLHARTFLQDATEFYDCYTCLERILAEYFTIYQHNGKWVILRVGELQTNPGAKIWYTEYNSAGTITGAAQYMENAAANGRDRLIHPVEVSQFISSNFAIKSSKYTYNYTIWPELPTNNKFERGTEFETGDQPDDQDFDGDGDTTEIIGTYKKYTIASWEQGRANVHDMPNPTLTPIAKKYYRRSIYNIYGEEIERAIVCETDDLVTDTQFWLRCEPIPVSFGDRIRIGWQKRYDNNFVGTLNAAFVGALYIVSDDGSKVVSLTSGGLGGESGQWITVEPPTSPDLGLFGRLIIPYSAGQNSTEWNSLNVESQSIPFSGTMYIAHACEPNPGTVGARQYWKDFSFEYLPYTAGGFVPVKGDYSQTSQDANFKDVIKEDVYISDSPKKVIQGALYREDLTTLTTPTWKRYSVNEARHFKEIGELSRFNNNYRRMWRMEGQYDGLKFTPIDNATFIEPLSFHRHFTFPDSPLLNGRYFVLVPPLNINYSVGRADMNFMEVLEADSEDGDNTGDTHIPIKYIFK